MTDALVISKTKELSAKDISLHAYCPSKTFIARSGVNPLVAAASALFSLIGKLRHAAHYEDSATLRENLVYEVKAFECAALERHYQVEQIILARYVICATLDEAILQTEWGRAGNWHRSSLVGAFDGDETTGERVFALLERLRHKTKDSIDLLEFFYLCLSLGFEGKYRTIDNGHQSLDHLLSDLYRTIRRERGESAAFLSMVNATPPKLPAKKVRQLPLKRILLIIGSILAVIYFTFIMMLHIEIKPIHELLSSIAVNVYT